MPASWRPYLWIAWPVTLAVSVALAVVGIWRSRMDLEGTSTSAAQIYARKRLLERVERDWVIDVLERSLYQEARLELALTRSVNAPHPWQMTSFRPGTAAVPVPSGVSILSVFRDLDQAILILGQPGSGKTTTMLELLRDLLSAARDDTSEPIPIFLPLASWTLRREPLAGWIVREVVERYGVPERYARAWVEADELILLLDGMDEVVRERREECIGAINAYRREHGTVPLAVCSRTADYKELRTKLTLYGTVAIQPLTRQQIEAFLDQESCSFTTARAVLTNSSELWKLINSPLILSILLLACNDADIIESLNGSGRYELLDRILITYVRAMLARRNYTRQQSRSMVRRLSFVAHVLQRNGQTIFNSDLIVADEVPKGMKARLRILISYWGYQLVTRGVVCLAALIFYGWHVSVIGWVLLGLLVPIAGVGYDHNASILPLEAFVSSEKRKYIVPNNRLRWALSGVTGSLVGAIVMAGVAGALLAWPQGLHWRIIWLPWRGGQRAPIFIWPNNLHWSVIRAPFWHLAIFAWPRQFDKAIPYTLVILCAWTLTVTTVEVTSKVWLSRITARTLSRDFPSPGLRVTLRSGIPVALIIGVLSGYLAQAIMMSLHVPYHNHYFDVMVAVWAAFIGFNCLGGRAFRMQTAVRLALSGDGFLPFRSQQFFDNATNCLILRRAGNRYFFAHRILQDFFVKLHRPADFRPEHFHFLGAGDRKEAVLPREELFP